MPSLSHLSWREYAQLVGLNLKTKLTNAIEYARVIAHYYSDPAFFKIDASLLLSYLFNNPFRISKQFLMSKGEQEVYTYGETPLTALDVIAKQCRLSISDTVFELGCGRGRTCFWLNHFLGCQVVGVDYVPAFIEKANRVKAKFHVQGVDFRLENFLETDLSDATVIYLYGTCYPATFIKQLIKRLESLPRGTKVITVSYALADFQPAVSFEVSKRFAVRFTWGVADAYLQIKK
ncbi:conserved hypothetical protein [Candidatus Protochlamydia naegleriophila]|uniref:Methyltransferase domain-containing protein n=1 Tax=Candidatus Protochlamydia naegleriophila TaxID=389348 RepID=A0A0U5JF59_9BACT|nr:class I SAM-dependent methyltransferase [Candidatus Protochlamydia naegleriophila]CUI16390.1 conserved hypothetical protein [Candidatus Protochlamydia naegleriophila]